MQSSLQKYRKNQPISELATPFDITGLIDIVAIAVIKKSMISRKCITARFNNKVLYFAIFYGVLRLWWSINMVKYCMGYNKYRNEYIKYGEILHWGTINITPNIAIGTTNMVKYYTG